MGKAASESQRLVGAYRGRHWSLEATNESEKFVGAVWGLVRWREEKCEQEQVKNDSFLLVVARVVEEGEDGQNKSFLTRSACWWLLRLREVKCQQ